MGHGDKFWLEEPSQLLASVTLLPSPDDSWEEKLNVVTRLVIVLAIILALLGWKHWFTFLVVAIIVIIMIYLLKQNNLIEHFDDFTYYNDSGVLANAKSLQYAKSQSLQYANAPLNPPGLQTPMVGNPMQQMSQQVEGAQIEPVTLASQVNPIYPAFYPTSAYAPPYPTVQNFYFPVNPNSTNLPTPADFMNSQMNGSIRNEGMEGMEGNGWRQDVPQGQHASQKDFEGPQGSSNLPVEAYYAHVVMPAEEEIRREQKTAYDHEMESRKKDREIYEEKVHMKNLFFGSQ